MSEEIQPTITIACPNCGMEVETAKPATTNIYGQCSFCDIKYRYDVLKKETILIVPASQQQYLYVTLEL